MRCPSCGGYEWLSGGKCKICGWIAAPEPRLSLGGDVDIWKLAEGLKNKKEADRRKKIVEHGLQVCSNCQAKALFYNIRDDQFECLKCKRVIISDMREYRTFAGNW